MIKLLKRAVIGVNASAGGHEKAAGAVVASKDWEKFKEQLMGN